MSRSSVSSVLLSLAIVVVQRQDAAALSAAGGGYDPEEAKMMASLASVAYCADVESVLQWTCGPCQDSKTRLVPGKVRVIDHKEIFQPNATRIFVGKLRDQGGCLMTFRGSSDLANWLRDLSAWEIGPKTFEDCDGCKVEDGFYTVWKNVRDKAVAALEDVGCSPSGKDNLVYVTGHSLGAALTHLAMFTLESHGYRVAKSYSFEAPRVGNPAFSDEFTKRFTRQFPVFRVTHHKDPVVHLPPELLGYRHVETEVYIDGSGNYKECDGPENKTCADQYGLDLLAADEHCASPLVPNGNICNCAASAAVPQGTIQI